MVGLFSSGNTDDTDNELHGNHTSGTVDEEGTTTKFLDDVEGDWGGQHVDEGGDQADQEGVVDRS